MPRHIFGWRASRDAVQNQLRMRHVAGDGGSKHRKQQNETMVMVPNAVGEKSPEVDTAVNKNRVATWLGTQPLDCVDILDLRDQSSLAAVARYAVQEDGNRQGGIDFIRLATESAGLRGSGAASSAKFTAAKSAAECVADSNQTNAITIIADELPSWQLNSAKFAVPEVRFVRDNNCSSITAVAACTDGGVRLLHVGEAGQNDLEAAVAHLWPPASPCLALCLSNSAITAGSGLAWGSSDGSLSYAASLGAAAEVVSDAHVDRSSGRPFPAAVWACDVRGAAVVSGGDEGALAFWDARDLRAPTAVDSKTHGAGVTATAFELGTVPRLWTGSYDGALRLWDLRATAAVLREFNVGHGIWRIRRDACAATPRVLVAATHGGARVFEARDGDGWAVCAELADVHESMCYGIASFKLRPPAEPPSEGRAAAPAAAAAAESLSADRAAPSSSGARRVASLALPATQTPIAGCVSCSFYDRRLALWTLK